MDQKHGACTLLSRTLLPSWSACSSPAEAEAGAEAEAEAEASSRLFPSSGTELSAPMAGNHKDELLAQKQQQKKTTTTLQDKC